MPTTIETTVYTFAELTDAAKERARDWFRQGMESDWYEFVYECADEVAGMLGIEIDRKSYKTMGGRTATSPAIYFSGFSSQGDGACFEGRYSYRKGALAAVKSEFPTDTDLHQIAKDLQEVQRRNFYQLSARVQHTGRYSHEYSTSIDVWKEDDIDCPELVDALRSFMRWIYKMLEAEYDYQTSDEQVDESILANEYTFTEEGDRA
jgi:hypothetical protein